MSLRTTSLAIVVLAAGAAACNKDDSDQNRPQLTQREKDSILGASKIPGAKAVKRALTSADSAAARQARLDSAEKTP